MMAAMIRPTIALGIALCVSACGSPGVAIDAGDSPADGGADGSMGDDAPGAHDAPAADALDVDGPVIDGPVVDGPVVDGPVVDGPVVDGQGLDGPSDASVLADAGASICTPRTGTTIALAPFVTGLDQPIWISSPDGDPRQFVIEQSGVIRVIKNGVLLPTPFLDLSGAAGPVLAGGERGLLGLAFHPDFGNNALFYVNFTRKPDGATVIAEFRASVGTDTSDVASRRDVLVIDQPFANHNGGGIEFGNDGKLYIGMGDGGSSGDPSDRAQNDTTLLGKMLRIDVDTRTGNKPYGIPGDNPHAASADGPGDPRPEIWHKGLRNPFRFSFDRGTGDLYIGDVGQDAWEEIDVAAGNEAAINWGWDDREGSHCFEPMTGCLTAGRRDPVVEHAASSTWEAVIGGQVYRGSCFPDLVGTYFYGDYVAGELWAFELVNGTAMNDRRVLQNVGMITAIHADAAGELYVVTHSGSIRRIVVP